MGLKYRIINQDELYFVTFTVVNGVDVFISDNYRQIFIDGVRYCQKEKGLIIGAWVIMTGHVHMIIGTDGRNQLEDIILDLKNYTSRHIRKEIEQSSHESRKGWMMRMFKRAGTRNNKNFQCWIQDDLPVQLSTPEMLLQRLNYIHNDPVIAGFVVDPQDWKYSSAYDYRGGRHGFIDLIMLA